MLMYIDVYWCILMYIDVYWCILMYIDVYWCILMYIDVYCILSAVLAIQTCRILQAWFEKCTVCMCPCEQLLGPNPKQWNYRNYPRAYSNMENPRFTLHFPFSNAHLIQDFQPTSFFFPQGAFLDPIVVGQIPYIPMISPWCPHIANG